VPISRREEVRDSMAKKKKGAKKKGK